MYSAYALGAHPIAAIMAAGFTGLNLYYPVQKTVRPPPEVVRLMFGTVVQVFDPETGVTEDLDIDQAIAKSEQFFHSEAGRGKQSATPMLKAFRVVAEALARVHPLIFDVWLLCDDLCPSTNT